MDIISFGALVEDKITGFQGYVIYRVEHMNDCIRYGIQPQLDKEGQLPDIRVLGGPDLKVIASPKADLPPTIKTSNAFNLGVKVKDRLTGFKGVIVLRVKHMHTGDRYGVQPPVNKKGEIPEIKSFDEEDLEQIDPPAPKKENKRKGPNGPHDHNAVMAR